MAPTGSLGKLSCVDPLGDGGRCTSVSRTHRTRHSGSCGNIDLWDRGAKRAASSPLPLSLCHVSIHTTPDARGHERRGRGRGRDGTSCTRHTYSRTHMGLAQTQPRGGDRRAERQAKAERPRPPRHARAYAQLARPPIAASALRALSSIRISSRHPGSARACTRSRIARPTSSRSALHLARRCRIRRRGRAGWHQPSRHHKRKGIGRDGPRKNCSMLFPATAAAHGAVCRACPAVQHPLKRPPHEACVRNKPLPAPQHVRRRHQTSVANLIM